MDFYMDKKMLTYVQPKINYYKVYASMCQYNWKIVNQLTWISMIHFPDTPLIWAPNLWHSTFFSTIICAEP